ncbi:hypothetical protein GG344DRAFT_64999 [Lentinula edodes]|nr:hypothetical protein GG344DRAFT_64999 [Lentinula edodes]
MDEYYNVQEARDALERIQQKHMEDKPMQMQLVQLTETLGWGDCVEVNKYQEPPCWRITWAQTDSEQEEVVLHMQGVVVDKRVLPIHGNRKTQKLKHLKQYVTISGLGNDRFQKDCDALMEIYARVARHVPELGAIEIKGAGDYGALEISSRIFTPREQAQTMGWADIGEDIDSSGFIKDVKASNAPYVYGEENVVYYGEEKKDENGELRTEKIRPDKLHIGDVVDVSFSVIALEGGKNKKGRAARLLLRSVEIIDGTHTQKWIKTKAMSQRRGKPAQLQLKKRREFDDGGVEDTRKRFKMLTTKDGTST